MPGAKVIIGTGSTSGVGLANLALGVADSYTEIGNRAHTVWRGQLYEAFAQEAWQVTPKLHLEYGVRETSNIPYYATWGNADFFDPALYNSASALSLIPSSGNVIVGSGNQYNGMVISGLSSFPSDAVGHGVTVASTSTYNSLFNSSYSKGFVKATIQFQPRLGLAYQLTTKSVMRAGVGRFLTRMGLLDNIFPGGNSPFQPFVTVTNVSVDNPGVALTSAVAAPITVTTLNRNLKPPEAWNWNFTFEQQTVLNTVVSVAYVAHRGLHSWEVFDINQPTVGALTANPGVSANYLRPTRVMRRSSRSRASPIPCTIPCRLLGTGASRADIVGRFRTRFPRATTMRPATQI